MRTPSAVKSPYAHSPTISTRGPRLAGGAARTTIVRSTSAKSAAGYHTVAGNPPSSTASKSPPATTSRPGRTRTSWRCLATGGAEKTTNAAFSTTSRLSGRASRRAKRYTPRVSRPPRILLLSPRQPFPPTRGDKLRVFHLARALGRRADVRVLSFGSEPAGPIEGVRERSVPHDLLPAIAANLAAPDPLLPMQVRLYLSRGMRAAVRDEIASHRPDVVHVTLARLAPYMSGLPPEVHVHVDFVDALSLNMLTRARGSRFPASAAFALEARLMARYEARVAARADSASVVSERDRLSSPGMASAAVIPNGVDVEELAFMAPAERAPVALLLRQSRLLPQHRAGPAGGARGPPPPPPPRPGRLPPNRGRPARRRGHAARGEGRSRGRAGRAQHARGAPPRGRGDPAVELRLRNQEQGPGGVRRRHAGRHEPGGHRRRGRSRARRPLSGGRRARRPGRGLPRRCSRAPTSACASPTAARRLVEEHYSWDSRAEAMLELYGGQGSRG